MFKISGSIALLSGGIFLIAVIYGVLVQSNIIYAESLLYFSYYYYVYPVCIVGYIGFGWLAVFSGCKFLCVKCHQPILFKEENGERVAISKALRIEFINKSTCAKCVK